MQKVVILDRDGVINHDSENYIRSPAEWLPIEGSLEAIAKLYSAGFRIFVITNQSGIARGYLSAESLQAIHQKMLLAVEQSGGRIERVFFCPHHPQDGCQCRKPQTGLIDQLRNYLQTDITGTPFVGDSLSDLQVAHASGCLPILVKTGKGQQTLRNLTAPLPLVFSDLAASAQWIIDETGAWPTRPG